MEPRLTVPDHLLAVLEELMRLEPLYHAAAPGATTGHFEELVDPAFWEIGASGRRYSREFALEVLMSRKEIPDEASWRTDDFHLGEIAPDHYLLTYTLHQPGRVTLRATLWRRAAAGWKALYHQGTVVQPQGNGAA